MTAGQTTTPPKRGAGSRILRLLLVGIIGIVVAASLLIAKPPASIIKDQIEKAATAAAGRPVTIADADITILPVPSISLNNVAVANAAGVTGPGVLQAQSVNARLKLRPLLSGKAEIESLEIIKPQINLVKGADGKTNWTFEPKEQTSSGLSATLLNGATIKDGVVSYSGPGTKEPVRFEKIDATIETSGKTTAKSVLALNGESANADIAIADLFAAASGKPADLTIGLDGKHLKGEIKGIVSSGATPEMTGDIALTSGSIRDLARGLGADVEKGAAPLPGSMKGKFKATATSFDFDGTDVAMGSDTGKLTGKLHIDGARPKYEGAIALSRIDLNAILGTTGPAVRSAGPEADTDDLELETAPAWDDLRATLKSLSAGPEAAASAAVKATPSSAPAWSENPIDLKILQSTDIDAVITSDALVLGKLDLKNAEIKTKLENGKLDARLNKLTIGGGSATGTLKLDSAAPVPRADVALNLVNVAAEPIITEITGKPLLAGTSNVDIVASSQGKNQNELASSVEGKATFRMSKGVIRGFDVRSIVSNWWSSLTGGLKFDINKKTGFEKLDAQYDIKKGVMTSSPGLDIGGSEVEVQSRGNVSLPAKRINQEIRVKVVPPPSAPPIPVKISGNWSKPSVSMDWGDLLFSSGVTAASARVGSDDAAAAAAPEAVTDSIAGGFQELAPSPEQIPDDIKAEIQRVLASPEGAAITPDGKALLETLAGTAAKPVPSEPEAAPQVQPAAPETPAAP